VRGRFGVDKHPKSKVWRVRIEVPAHLRPFLQNRAVFTKSLGTKKEAEARAMAASAQAPFLRLLEQAQVAYDAAVESIDSAPLSLTRDVASSNIADWAAMVRTEMADAIWRHGRSASLAGAFPEFGSAGPLGVQKAFKLAVVESYRERGDVPDWQEPLRRLLRRLMSERGVLVPEDAHPATQAALTLLHGTVATLANEQRDLLEGAWSLPTGVAVSAPATGTLVSRGEAAVSPPSAGGTPGSDAVTVKQMLERHLARTQASRSTAYEMKLAVRRLLAFFEADDIELKRITFTSAEGFLDALRRLPKSMTKRDWERGFPTLIEDYEAGRDQRPRLSRPTIAKIVNLLHAMLNSAVKRGLAERQVFGGLVSKGDTKPVTPRRPFTPSQIETIFTAPLFTGCASSADWATHGNHVVDDERRWLPLLGITTGIRLEEAGQLLMADIKEQSGITYLDITETLDDDEVGAGNNSHAKSIKTAPSRRRVPIHPMLIEVGFLDYVARRRAARDVRLFPNLKINSKGKWTSKFSEWFNRDFLRSIGLTDRSRRFHSFRHNFVDNAREVDAVKDDVRKALLGHSGNSAHSNYGHGFSIKVLHRAMSQIEVPGFPLDRLRALQVRAA
jgi:integrase